MRLRTFESFWLLKNGLLNTYPMLRQDVSTDIIVIGGGITGALISHALIQQGYNVVLLDKRDIALGSTSATTSMLQYEIDTPLFKLAEMMGEEEAAQCYRSGIDAIDNLGDLINQYKIDCGFKKQDSLYIAHNKKAAVNLQKEFIIRDKHKLGVAWLTAKDILDQYGLKSYGGILSSKAASVDAYKLAHELIAMNVKNGLSVYDQTIIKDYRFKKAGVELTSAEGHLIKGQQVIFCTGFEATNMLKEKVAKLIFTWVTISEEGIKLSDKLQNTLVWDTNDPYLYMRSTDDGRLLVGGEDSNYRMSQLNTKTKERKSKKLVASLEKIMGDVEFIEDHNWGGVFGKTKDGLPYIGKSPEYQNALFVLGFGGNGITFSIQAMEIIIDMLQGKPNQLSQFYRFGR